MFVSISTTFPLAFMVTLAWAFVKDSPSPGSPIQGHGIFIPRWVVPSPDGSGKTLSLRGTVEEVAAQMRGLGATFDIDDDFGKIATPAIERRAVFTDEKPTLCHNFGEGNRSAVHVGIDYLRTELESFADIADGAQRVLDKCLDKLDAKQGDGKTVSGQAFHKDGWNVVIRGGDDCENSAVNINSR
ncbi:secreted protein [Colletotrichum higginsianum]|nr:secreted protein [Colletotrichum higginsianum]